jgi:hypothetical protein
MSSLSGRWVFSPSRTQGIRRVAKAEGSLFTGFDGLAEHRGLEKVKTSAMRTRPRLVASC